MGNLKAKTPIVYIIGISLVILRGIIDFDILYKIWTNICWYITNVLKQSIRNTTFLIAF